MASDSSSKRMKSRKGLKSIPNYAKNIIKSTAYATGDFFKETMPGVSEFVSTNTEFNRSIINGIRNHKQIYKNTKKMIADSKSVYALKQIKKNAISDLKTGTFYNAARQDKNSLESTGWGDMLNQDDFFNDDFSDMSSADISTDDIVKQSTDMLGGAIVSGANASIDAMTQSTNSLISSNAEIGTSIIESSNNNTTRSIINESRLFNDLNGKLEEIHNTNKSISSSLQNTNSYYNKSMELGENILNSVNEISANIKEMVEMEREKYRDYNESKQYVDTPNDSPFDYAGTFNIAKYLSNVKQNLGSEINTMFGGMGSFFGDDGNALLTLAGSPLQFIPKLLISKAVGPMLKKSMTDFDKTFKAFIQNGMSKFTDVLSEKGTSFGLGNTLTNIFGIKKGTHNYIDTGDYVKGAVPFDGITKKAIEDVIPTYLRKILAAITNSSEMIYNYDYGTFNSIEELTNAFNSNLEYSYTSAFGKVNNDIMTTISESLDLSQKATSEYMQTLTTLEKSFADSGKFFNPKKLTTTEDLRNAGIFDINADDEKYKNIIRTITNFGPDMWNKMNDNIRKSGKEKDGFIKEVNSSMTNSGNSALFNGFNTEISRADKYGYDSSSYLRNIYKLLVHGIKTFPQNSRKANTNKDNDNSPSGGDGNIDNYFAALSDKITEEDDEYERRVSEYVERQTLHDDPNKINNSSDLIRRHNLTNENDAENLSNSAIDDYLTNRYGNDYNLRINNLSQLGMAEIQRMHPSNSNENTSIFSQIKDAFKNVFEVPREIGKSFLDNARITMNNFLYGDDQEHESLISRFNEKVHEFTQKIVDGFNNKIFKPLSDFIGKLNLKDKFNTLKTSITDKFTSIKNSVFDGQSETIARFSNKMFGSKFESMSSREFYNSYIKNNMSGTKKGAAIGALASLFTPFGLVGGTLLGSGIGTVMSSETFKTKMFGEMGDDGRRKGGLISKSTMTKFEKMLPNLKKSMGIGAVASLFTPFGLVGGTLLGGTIGFASHLEGVKHFLFGKKDSSGVIDDSKALIKQAWVKRFKEMVPGMKIGAGAGLLSSIFMPYGPIGGAVFGLTASIIGQSETVKEFLFGSYNPDTNEGKTGLFQKIEMFVKAEILSPLKTYTQYMFGRARNWFTENMVNPFLESLDPIKKEFSLMKEAFKEQVKAGWQSTKDFIGTVFEKTVGEPFGKLMETKFIDPMKEMFKKMFGGMGRIIGKIVKAPVTMLHDYAMKSMKKHIKNGDADYLEKWKAKKAERDKKLAEKKAKTKALYEARKKKDDEISQLLKDGKYDLRNPETKKARILLGIGVDIKDAIKNSSTSIKDTLFKTNGILDKISQTINSIFGTVKNFASEKLNDIKEDKHSKPESTNPAKDTKDKTPEHSYDSIIDSIKKFFNKSDDVNTSQLKDNKASIDSGNSILNDIKKKIDEFINKSKDKTKEKFNDAKDKVKEKLNEVNKNIKGYMPDDKSNSINVNGTTIKSSKNKKENTSNQNTKNTKSGSSTSQPNTKRKSLLYDDSLSTTNKYLSKIYDNVDGQIRNVGYNTSYIKRILIKKFGKINGKDIKEEGLHRIRSIFSKPKEFIKNIFGIPINFVRRAVDKVKEFGSKIVELPKKALGLLGGAIKIGLKGLGELYNIGKFTIKELYKGAKFFGKELYGAIKFAGTELYGAMKFTVKELYGATKAVGAGLLKATSFVVGNSVKLISSIGGKVLKTVAYTADKITTGIGTLLKLGGKMFKGVVNIGKTIGGFAFDKIKKFGGFIGKKLGFGESSNIINRVKVIDLVKRVKRVDEPVLSKILNKIGDIISVEKSVLSAIKNNNRGNNNTPALPPPPTIGDGGTNLGGIVSNLSNSISKGFSKIGAFGKFVKKSILGKFTKVDGSHKNGLDYVPKDGYIAELHKGERVLTANENKKYDSNKESIAKHFMSKEKSESAKRNNIFFRNNSATTHNVSLIYGLLSKTYGKKGMLNLALTGILAGFKWIKEKGFNLLKNGLFSVLEKLGLKQFGNVEQKIEKKIAKKAEQKVAEKTVEKVGAKVVEKKVAEKTVSTGIEHMAEKKVSKNIFSKGIQKAANSKIGTSLNKILKKIFESDAMKKICTGKLSGCIKALIEFLTKKLPSSPSFIGKICAKWGILASSGALTACIVPAVWYGSEMSLGVAETKKIFKLSPNSKPTALMRLVAGFTRIITNNITFGFIDMYTVAMFIGRLIFGDKDYQVLEEGQNQLKDEFESDRASGNTDAQNIDDYNYNKNKTLIDRADDALSNAWNKTKEGTAKLWNKTKEGTAKLWEGIKEAPGAIKDTAISLWDGTKKGISKIYGGTKKALIYTDAVFGTIFNLRDNDGKPITLSMWAKNKASKAWDATKKLGKNVLDGAKSLWGKTKKGVSNVLESIGDGLSAMNENIGNALGLKDKNGNPVSLTSYIKSKVTNGWETTKEFGKNVLDGAKSLWGKTKKGVSNTLESIGDGLSAMNENIGNALGLKNENGNSVGLIEYSKNKIKSAFSAIGDMVSSVKDLAKSVWGSIKDKFSDIKDNIGKGLEHLDSSVGSILGFTDDNGESVGLVQGVKNKISSVGSFISNVKDKFLDGVHERIESFNGGNGGKQRKNHGYINNKIRGGMGTSNQFSQNDPRWSNISYGESGTIGSSGCGPMAAASALSDATGMNISPMETMNYALQNGYRDYTVGTTWDYFNNIGKDYGVNMQQTTDYNQTVKNALKQGKPVILSGVGGKPFTDTGHYIVGKGIDSSGNILVNDPESNDNINVYKFNDVVKNASQAWVTNGTENINNNTIPDNVYGFGPGGADAATATKIMNAALGVVGTPYVWGGKGEPLTRNLISSLQRQYPGNKYSVPDKFYDGKHIAVDCSGLVGYAYKQAGINIPAGTSGQLSDTSHAVSPGSPIHPADLLYPKRGHVVMALGGNKIVHAPKTGDYVKVQDLYFKPQYIRRYLPNTEGAVPNMSNIGNGANIGSTPISGGQSMQERPKTLAEKLSDAKSNIGKLMAGYVTSSMLGEEFGETEINNILNPNPTGGDSGGFSGGPVGTAGNLDARIDKFNDIFNSAGQKYGVDPNIMKAIAMQESGGDPRCGYPNHAAWGLMQIENTLKNEYAQYGQQNVGSAYTLQDRLDPSKAIPFATYRFASDLKHYAGDYAKAIQSYNFSKYSLDKLIAHTGASWRQHRAEVGQYNGTHSKRYGDPNYIEHVVRYYKGQNQAITALKGGNGDTNKSVFRATKNFVKNIKNEKIKGGNGDTNTVKHIKYNIFNTPDNNDISKTVVSSPINEYNNIVHSISSSGNENYHGKLDTIIKLLVSLCSSNDKMCDLVSIFNNDFNKKCDYTKIKNESIQQNNNQDTSSPIIVNNNSQNLYNEKASGINRAYENAKRIARGVY